MPLSMVHTLERMEGKKHCRHCKVRLPKRKVEIFLRKAKKETNPPSSTVPGPQRPADGTSALMPDIKITVAIPTLPLMNMINDRFNVS